jgi:hypothetical protein
MSTINQELSHALHRCHIYQSDGEDRRVIPDDLRAQLSEAHICPTCASHVAIPHLVHMRFCVETPSTNPGYECPICEEFFPTRSRLMMPFISLPPSTRNARIWVWLNDAPVKITLKPGQTLRWSHAARTEEGWSSESHEWHWDGQLVEQIDTDGRDCDGRLSTSASYFTTPHLFQAHEAHEPPDSQDVSIRFPRWEKISAHQRDYSAESMGY